MGLTFAGTLGTLAFAGTIGDLTAFFYYPILVIILQVITVFDILEATYKVLKALGFE